eukprot:CAMPEP_0182864212 /NCGR_PEP_ID=MMETSP0034_2-20130328/7056_1 /TAXON_ID=156128 /ORGANISM="Nephroselmis pyriformis, Strain CCMP717" /LENGTH=85 /DNA_ID=CAMNT_0024996463 /DNA_START=104 /DNA_END=358 /DNA_ORIENTATION=+
MVPKKGTMKNIASNQLSENLLTVLAGMSLKSPDITDCWKGERVYTTSLRRIAGPAPPMAASCSPQGGGVHPLALPAVGDVRALQG